MDLSKNPHGEKTLMHLLRDLTAKQGSSWSDVVDRAQLFFQAGAPFSTLTDLQRDRLTGDIRNRIAHSSTKVRNDFNEVARRHLGLAPDKKLSEGYDVGQLLLDKCTKCFAKGLKQAIYFEHYAHLFYEMADHICPAPTEANGRLTMPSAR
jgi:hypothetical protein